MPRPERTAPDSQNEITAVGAASLTSDNNGNVTTNSQGYTLTYDAWNRLMTSSSGSLTETYNALGQVAIMVTTGGTNDYFYNMAGNIVQNRTSPVYSQFVWGLMYTNQFVLRDENSASGGNYGGASSGLNQRIYAQFDANWNVTSLFQVSGTPGVAERIIYDAYGKPTLLTAAWANYSGSTLYFRILFQGTYWLNEANVQIMGARDYDFTTGAWDQKDPAGYKDGSNLYQFVVSDPIRDSDPTGLNHGPIRPIPMTPGAGSAKSNRVIDRLNNLLSPEEKKCPTCLQEMVDLATAINNAVAEPEWQPPGDVGNFFSGLFGMMTCQAFNKSGLQGWQDGLGFLQCGDWQNLLIDAIQPVLEKYGKSSCARVFTADALKPGILFDSTHSWVEVTGANGTVVLDPWLNAGSTIVNNSVAATWDNKYVRRVQLVHTPSKRDVIPGGQQPTTQPTGNSGKCCP